MSTTTEAPRCAHCRKGFEPDGHVYTFRGKAGSGLLHTYCLNRFTSDYVEHQADHVHLLRIIGGVTVMATPENLTRWAEEGVR